MYPNSLSLSSWMMAGCNGDVTVSTRTTPTQQQTHPRPKGVQATRPSQFRCPTISNVIIAHHQRSALGEHRQTRREDITATIVKKFPSPCQGQTRSFLWYVSKESAHLRVRRQECGMYGWSPLALNFWWWIKIFGRGGLYAFS